ncbi:hypothetical protein SUGI_0294400 [Cryptomeria japonica]|uniref:uncharacterized protein LOC131051126 n=1 Tax=Cryptomeria japonica TaxID=3369 RepID=UPI002408F0CE|nr:uncharacterized protein LOC131051126 [Cryptomeria japonica]GLJ17016.1 hypothetical protein SUGI_0294400 [Cryptomeria japonica]
MVPRHAEKLACDLITTQFGELVGKVCNCLVYKGNLALHEIARFTELTPAQLKNCLLVLIQHNCVQAYRVEAEEGLVAAKIFTQYSAIVNNILHRMRFAKFLALTREHLGEESESLLEGLLEHGRLTLEQLIQRAVAQSGKGESEIEGPLKETFSGLVRSHFIERCPVPEPVLPLRSESAPKKVVRGSARSRKAVKDTEQETEEQRIIAAAAPLEGERFLLPSSVDHDMSIDKGNDDSIRSSKIGEKRKYECLKEDAWMSTVANEKEILWRANYEEFVRRLRHKACASHVRARLDLRAGTVLEAMLEATMISESSAKPKISAPLSMSAIEQAVLESKEGRIMTMDRIQACLDQMSSDSVGYLTRAREMDGQYIINMHKILLDARKSEVEAIVRKRYGIESCRIFKLLAMKGQLEQKQISEQALVGRKETLELLYKLFKDGYLQMQEIAKSQDHAPSKTFYLWRVNYPNLMERIVDDMYHAASNLGQRLAHELEQEQEVIDLLKQMHQSKATDGSTSQVTLTKSQREKKDKMRRIATILEASLLKLDDSLMLFHDF